VSSIGNNFSQLFARFSSGKGAMSFKECSDFLQSSVQLEADLNTSDYDSVVIVGTSLTAGSLGKAACYLNKITAAKSVDAAFEKQVSLIAVDGVKVIYSPTGPLDRDQDDIRSFSDAAIKGIKRAISAGGQRLLIVLPKVFTPFNSFNVDSSVVLGALEAVYVPIEIREDIPDRKRKVEKLGFLNFTGQPQLFNYLRHVEAGRLVARDIGGSDPERMAPPKVEEYVRNLFAETPEIKVTVVENREQLEANYPCLAAVDRCASHVPRHRARMLLLEYNGQGNPDQVLCFVGKGVTYDTGGADIKAGGIMAGMHRDKCGSAAVGGLFQTLAGCKPKNLRVLGAMCMVRNSVGSDAYVADELITSRAGVRIRVGNTDAEGRMAMVDALAEMKEIVLNDNQWEKANLFTIATLTGHACLAVGEPYSITLDNGPAKAKKTSQTLQQSGDQIGDLFEISTLRREDYDFVVGKSEYEDILQCNNAASSRTPRGHQMPAAFLVRVSGLDKHGKNSSKPIAYSHLDIAAGSGPFPGIPSGSPVAALALEFFYSRI